jgi:hypothetical protein
MKRFIMLASYYSYFYSRMSKEDRKKLVSKQLDNYLIIKGYGN